MCPKLCEHFKPDFLFWRLFYSFNTPLCSGTIQTGQLRRQQNSLTHNQQVGSFSKLSDCVLFLSNYTKNTKLSFKTNNSNENKNMHTPHVGIWTRKLCSFDPYSTLLYSLHIQVKQSVTNYQILCWIKNCIELFTDRGVTGSFSNVLTSFTFPSQIIVTTEPARQLHVAVCKSRPLIYVENTRNGQNMENQTHSTSHKPSLNK